MRHIVCYFFILPLFLTADLLFAQCNVSKQPHPDFRYRADNGTDTARIYNVAPSRENRAVSVCAVWNLSDTAVRTLWRMADSTGKVAAEAGGKAVRAGVPVVRTDIAGLPRRMRKTPLTFSLGGDSVRRDALLEGLFDPYALTVSQRMAAESYLALKYGITLHEDYLSPNGDTLWFYNLDKMYNHAIAGIGRDTLHGLDRVEGVSAESALLKMRLLPSTNNGRAELLPGQYMLWGASEGKLSFGYGNAFATVADSIVLFDLMERAWLVRATDVTNCRTQISIAADSLTGTDSLYLLIDRSGKGVFDGAECHGPARADSSGLFTFAVCWDNDNSGSDLFTFARAGLPQRQMSTMMNGEDDGNGNPGAATGIRNAENPTTRTAVWPNPVSETLHVQSGMAAPVEAFVTDSHGKLLLRKSSGQSGFDLNVGGLASGSYTLLLRNNEGSRSISFVVKKVQ